MEVDLFALGDVLDKQQPGTSINCTPFCRYMHIFDVCAGRCLTRITKLFIARAVAARSTAFVPNVGASQRRKVRLSSAEVRLELFYRFKNDCYPL